MSSAAQGRELSAVVADYREAMEDIRSGEYDRRRQASSAAQGRWTVTVNGQTKIVPAPNVLVAMHRGIERIGVPDAEIQKLVVSRVY